MRTPFPPTLRGLHRGASVPCVVRAIVLIVSLVSGCGTASAQLAQRGALLLEENFSSAAPYEKAARSVKDGWTVRVAHAGWVRSETGIRSQWTSGHMPVLVFEGAFGDVIIEVDFRYEAQQGNWAACRVSATNQKLNPRAYAVSVWANQDNKARAPGMVLEHDEWKPGTITTVANAPASFAPGKWHTLRLEIVGDRALSVCNGVTVEGRHEKFALPKTSLWLGVGTCPHELRNLRVYAAKPINARQGGQ